MVAPHQFWSEERNLSWLLAALAFETLILDPVLTTMDLGLSGQFIDGLAFSMVLLLGLYSLTNHKAMQVVFGLVTAVIIVLRSWRLLHPDKWLYLTDILLSTLCMVTILVVVLLYVYKKGPVTAHRIQGAVAGYLLIAMVFATGFSLINALVPRAFNFSSSMTPSPAVVRVFYYFSVCTLTTVGYGDVTPVHPFARSLMMMEAFCGQLYPVILIARLVTLYSSDRGR